MQQCWCLPATLLTVVPVGTGVYSKPEEVPTKLHILNPVLCTICTTENQRRSHLLFYCGQSLTRRIRPHSTFTNSDLVSSLKPTNQLRKLHSVVWCILKKVLKEIDFPSPFFFLSFPPDSAVFLRIHVIIQLFLLTKSESRTESSWKKNQ